MAYFAAFYIFSLFIHSFIHSYLFLICLIHDLPERDYITSCVLIKTWKIQILTLETQIMGNYLEGILHRYKDMSET